MLLWVNRVMQQVFHREAYVLTDRVEVASVLVYLMQFDEAWMRYGEKWKCQLGLGLCSFEDPHGPYLGLAIAKHKGERRAQDAEGFIGIPGIDRVLGGSVQLPGAERVRGAPRSWARTLRRRER